MYLSVANWSWRPKISDELIMDFAKEYKRISKLISILILNGKSVSAIQFISKEDASILINIIT